MADPRDADTSCTQVASCLDRERPDRAQHAREVVATLEAALSAAGIQGEVFARVKSPRSVRERIRRRGVSLRGLHDICGVRVLVRSIPDCYEVLRIAYSLWPHVPEAFDDYIAFPKENGYQSLHAALQLPCGHTIELQIRTYEQHREAETGRAAHRRYKLTTAVE